METKGISLFGNNADNYYVPQFEPREKIEEQVEMFYGNIDELRNEPCWNWCGMCTLAMILKSRNICFENLEKMYAEAFDFGVYRNIGENVVGAYHAKLAEFAQYFFNVNSYPVRNLSVHNVEDIVCEGSYFIASVTPEIRNFPEQPLKKNGHLILVFGVNEKRELIFHNSAGFSSNNTQASVGISLEHFDRYFSGNGIFVI